MRSKKRFATEADALFKYLFIQNLLLELDPLIKDVATFSSEAISCEVQEKKRNKSISIIASQSNMDHTNIIAKHYNNFMFLKILNTPKQGF